MSEFDKLWALEAKATAGPWKVLDRESCWSAVSETVCSYLKIPKDVFDDGSACGEYGVTCEDNDRDFIVAARNAMPALKAAVEERDRLRAAFKSAQEAKKPCQP